MELAIVLVLVFTLWTSEILFPKKKKDKSVEEKLADALKDYLKEGIQVRQVPPKK
ncbi:MAG: hypothetical protein WBG38_02005 [Nodosilinea sp.]